MMDAKPAARLRQQLKDDRLYAQMREAVREMEAQLGTLCRSEDLEMSKDLERIVMAGGKRLRPTLAWICHRIGDGEKMEILPLMCMLELMHTASLIHDDVVDDAPLRRGEVTIHKSSGRCAAVQSGDFLLARAMEYLHIYRGTGINEALAEVSTQMCLGEFQQMDSLFDTKRQNRESYFEQIKRKTACLISASCYTGAVAGRLPESAARALRTYGEQVGLAFQLKDDILDFMGTDAFGKAPGQDVREGIFTLPLLYALENRPDAGMEELAKKRDKTEEDVKTLLAYVSESHGIEHAEFQIRVCSHRALRALAAIPACREKDALVKMAHTLMRRTL